MRGRIGLELVVDCSKLKITLLLPVVCVSAWLGCVAAGDREIAGRVLPGPGASGEPPRLVVSLVPAAEARVRWERFCEVALSNRLEILGRMGRLGSEKESLEQEKTKKVYRRQFSEVGPAEKGAIQEELEELNRRIGGIQQEYDIQAKVLTNWSQAEPLFRKPWTNGLASARCALDGGFRLHTPVTGTVWVAAWAWESEKSGGGESPGWLLAWPEQQGGFLWLAPSNSVSALLEAEVQRGR